MITFVDEMPVRFYCIGLDILKGGDREKELYTTEELKSIAENIREGFSEKMIKELNQKIHEFVFS